MTARPGGSVTKWMLQFILNLAVSDDFEALQGESSMAPLEGPYCFEKKPTNKLPGEDALLL